MKAILVIFFICLSSSAYALPLAGKPALGETKTHSSAKNKALPLKRENMARAFPIKRLTEAKAFALKPQLGKSSQLLAEDIPTEFSRSLSTKSTMTAEQAQQLLSIFPQAM